MDIYPSKTKDIALIIQEPHPGIPFGEILLTFNSDSYTYIKPYLSSPSISIELLRDHKPLTPVKQELFTKNTQNNSDDENDGDPEEDDDIDDDDEFDEDDDNGAEDGSSTSDSEDEDEFDERDGDEDEVPLGAGNGSTEEDDADDHAEDEDFEDDDDLDEDEYGSDWDDDDDEDDSDDDDELKPLNSSNNHDIAQFSPSLSLETRPARSSRTTSDQTGQGPGYIDFDIT